jgi:hypothetical protein
MLVRHDGHFIWPDLRESEEHMSAAVGNIYATKRTVQDCEGEYRVAGGFHSGFGALVGEHEPLGGTREDCDQGKASTAQS